MEDKFENDNWVVENKSRDDLFSIKPDEDNSIETERDNFVKFARSQWHRVEDVDLWRDDFWVGVYNHHLKIKRSPFFLAKEIIEEFFENFILLVFSGIATCVVPPVLLSFYDERDFSLLMILWNDPVGILLFMISFLYYFARFFTKVLSVAGGVYSIDKLIKKYINSDDVQAVWNAYELAKKGILSQSFLQVPGEPVNFKIFERSRK